MEPLPPRTHLIHVGPQKTGSTSIQWALHRARGALREHGVIYPGPGPRVADAAEFGLGFRRNNGQEVTARAWRRLVRQVNPPGPELVCLSHEAFGRADDDQIQKIVAELGGDRPHMIAVARRYDSLMPSQWQQRVKSGVAMSYATWLEIVLDDERHRHRAWRNVWVPHDTVTLARRWASVIGAENITVVASDETRRTLVPETFEQLLGVPAGTIDLSTVPHGNPSLTYDRVEVVREVNRAFKRHGWSGADYHVLVRRGVIRALVNAEPEAGERRLPPLPQWARERLVELSDQRIDGLRDLPVRVVGDLEALRVSSHDGPEDIGPPVDRVPLSTAALALEGMALGLMESREKG
jgi:hypothetical protein